MLILQLMNLFLAKTAYVETSLFFVVVSSDDFRVCQDVAMSILFMLSATWIRPTTDGQALSIEVRGRGGPARPITMGGWDGSHRHAAWRSEGLFQPGGLARHGLLSHDHCPIRPNVGWL